MGKADHVHMPTQALAPSVAESDPETLLAEVVASGWPRLIVPRALGGEGATHPELADALLQLARRHPAAAWTAWSHGLVIEALLRSGNVALRDMAQLVRQNAFQFLIGHHIHDARRDRHRRMIRIAPGRKRVWRLLWNQIDLFMR